MPGKFLVCLKIAVKDFKTFFQAIQIVAIVNTGSNLGKSTKVENQNKHTPSNKIGGGASAPLSLVPCPLYVLVSSW